MPEAISIQTIARLKKYAEPLVDTIDSVVNKLIDAYEEKSNAEANIEPIGKVAAFDGASPPNLTFTTMHRAIINGSRLSSNATTWNGLMLAAVKEAKKNLSTEEVSGLLIANHVVGKKLINGYKYLEGVGISVQGQDANNAWKATFQLIKELKISCLVEFSWQDHPKASSPGSKGMFSIVAQD